MNLKKIIKFNLFIFFSLLFIFPFTFVKATGIPSPTLLEVNITSQQKLEVNGLTPNKSKILIYVDGKFKNLANIKEISKKEVNSFNYLSSSEIPPGRHDLTVVAQKQNSTIMSPPVNYDFQVYGQTEQTQEEKDPKIASYKTPAPTLLHPHSLQTTNTKPKILGLTAQNTKVKVYLDGSLLSETDFLDHPSGTAGFILTPPKKLTLGSHKIWAKAVDKKGEISAQSNILNFNITSVKDQKTFSLDPPQILAPKNGIKKPLSELSVSGQTDQSVDAFRIYIDDKFHTQITTQVSNNGSQFSYDLQGLDRGDHTLYVTSVKGDQESPSSSQITFTATKPQINGGVKEDKTSSSSTSTADKNDFSATSSLTGFMEKILTPLQEMKYILFIILVIGVVAGIAWLNKNTIKNFFKK